MKIDRKDMEANLPKKGFERNKSGDHIYFHHIYKGKKTAAYTKLSHTKKMREITGNLLTTVQRQLRLNGAKEVVELVNCPMDGDKYNSILIRNGIIPK